MSRPPAPVDGRPWDRGKLVAILAAAVVACLALVLGLGMALYYSLHSRRHPAIAAENRVGLGVENSTASAKPSAAPGSPRHAEDELAAKPMPSVDLAAAEPGTVSSRNPGSLIIPVATGTGADGVPSGFPHTAAGALAQLAAIDRTAMQTGTLAGVRAVIVDWAAPGGPTPTSWSAVKAMADFLNSAGMSGGGSTQLALIVTPLMGLIKGTVGADFVVPCVDFQVDATIASTAHVADADCQRMVWQDTRWLIGPGAEPSNPPSVWADTDIAIAVGYKDLRNG